MHDNKPLITQINTDLCKKMERKMFEEKVKMYCMDCGKSFMALKGELMTCSCPICGAGNHRIVVFYQGVVNTGGN